MKKFSIKKTFAVGAMALTVMSASAQDKVIDGYFRIQTLAGKAANANYVEVTGPFTAKPNLTYEQAKQSAGTVFYISAVQDNRGGKEQPVYRLTNLRTQGIDASMDAVNPDKYEKILTDAINEGGSAVHALVRQGFKHGYTSVARATVGTVFSFVASALEKYGNEGTGVSSETYLNVARDFNKEVVANLDLGIRLMPVFGADNKMESVQLFYDVPNLQAVCDWYLAEDTEEHKARKATFESAMAAMSYFLQEKYRISLEDFLPNDIELLKSWGYDISAAYPNSVVNVDINENETISVVKTDFKTIFSDPDLLFNWIKMVGYYIINPEKDTYKRFDELGMQGLNDKMHEHYLTSLLADYMPRLRPGQRVFLVNGEGNNLDFASVNGVELAGDNGKWVITPIDNETQVYAPTERLNPYEVSDTELKYYTALYLDFPVKAKDTANTKFFTLSEEKTATVTGETLSYTELVAIDGEVIAAHTPFIVESAQKDATLVIPNEYVFTALTPMPDNAVIVGEDETVTQHAPARVDEAQPAATRELRGVLLPTAATPEALKNYWNLDEAKPAYTYDAAITHGSDVQTGFRKAEGTINANEALYVPDTDRNYNMVLIGEPKPYIITGIEGVGADGEADEVLYDLNGRRVSEPVPGQIYVLKGRKIIAH